MFSTRLMEWTDIFGSETTTSGLITASKKRAELTLEKGELGSHCCMHEDKELLDCGSKGADKGGRSIEDMRDVAISKVVADINVSASTGTSSFEFISQGFPKSSSKELLSIENPKPSLSIVT